MIKSFIDSNKIENIRHSLKCQNMQNNADFRKFWQQILTSANIC